ncbi:unnamed protein product [Rotaria sordida]|nr:unnamed protein product [Rotaria sordida]
MVINSWIIMNSRLCGDDSYNSTCHGKFRLFHFKSEIAKFLLTKPNIQIFPTAAINSSVNVYQSDEENEPPTKKLREARSSVIDVVRYDSSDHWPLFISALNNTRCKNENCSGKTYWQCSKCKVHLCLNSSKNCFTEYHTAK